MIEDTILVVLLTTFLYGVTQAVQADEWTRADTGRQVAYTALLGLDMATTLDIKNHDDTHESGIITRQILGRNPETLPTVGYFAAVGVLNYAVARNLPSKYRKPFQILTSVLAGGHVIHNWRIGLRPTWR